MSNGNKLQNKIKGGAKRVAVSATREAGAEGLATATRANLTQRLKASSTGVSEYLSERVTPSYLIGAVKGAGITGAPSKKDIIPQDKSHSFNPIKSKYPKQP